VSALVSSNAQRKGSRLDSFIRRLEAQRACLDWAVSAIAGQTGIVLELGLGNGRTYDHLRHRCGGAREIYAFDRHNAAHPACVPDARHLVLGDFHHTLARFASTHSRAAALIHADIGSGDETANAALARWLGPVLIPLAAPNAIVLCDQALSVPRLSTLALPSDVPPDRYFAYRMT
jgi:hypothetical protein